MKKTRVKSLRTTAIVSALCALTIAVGALTSLPAHADWDHHPGGPRWHETGWERHEHDAWYWRHHHPHYEPGYVAAPPPVVYYPPQSSGINLIIPLHIH